MYGLPRPGYDPDTMRAVATLAQAEMLAMILCTFDSCLQAQRRQ